MFKPKNVATKACGPSLVALGFETPFMESTSIIWSSYLILLNQYHQKNYGQQS